MTDILCRWLNDDLGLSRIVSETNFGHEFATGYLIGETLYRYQLQDDFDQFSQSRTNDSKLNNFTRLEPTLHLLEIPFDTNIARAIMTEQHGVATRLMYQLFIALNKKQKANLTGVAMETMRPAAPVKLEGVESEIYKKRLKHLTPRQTDLNLDALMSKFKQKRIQLEQTAFKDRFEEEERQRQKIQDERQELIRKFHDTRSRQTEMIAKIQAATVHIPKPPPNTSAKAVALRKETRKAREVQETMDDIQSFEETMLRTAPPSKQFGEPGSRPGSETSQEKDEVSALPDTLDLIKPASNSDYINKIRKRLNEDESAREEREKRRRKVLVDQMKSHEAQEEARREEMLVNRLMRQSQQERRIAVQLLQTRHEKEVIRNNRILREKQYQERRQHDFEEALNREAEMARLAKQEYMEQTQKDLELHNQLVAQQAQARYERHYNMCMETLNSVVDFSCKVAEYRELTAKLIPPKLIREWTALFVEGKPLYEIESAENEETDEVTPEKVLEEECQQLLDETEFMEYKTMIKEWQPPEGSVLTSPVKDNAVLGYIVQRLFNMVHPPSPPPPPPEFPPFPIKACILGKVFSGKSTCVKKLAESHRLKFLCVDELVTEAIEAFKSNELVEVVEDESSKVAPPSVPATAEGAASQMSVKSEIDDNKNVEENANANEEMEKGDPEKPVDDSAEEKKSMLSERAKLGSRVTKMLKKGKPVDDQMTIDILTEAIRRVPENTGWVLDGFPTTYAQAKLLEKALSGFDTMSRESTRQSLKDKQEKSKPKKSLLAPDPKPSPPAAEPVSGINLVLLFDITDELSLKRSAGRTYALQSGVAYQTEFKPPPEGSTTGIGKVEKVVAVEDTAHDMEQIQHRLTTFSENWPKLEKWFTKFGSLKKVDASGDEDIVYNEVNHMLEESVAKILAKDQESSEVVETSAPKPEEKPPEPPKVETPPPAEPPKEESPSRPGSKKGSRAGSAKRSRSASPKDSAKKRDKSDSPKRGSRAGSKDGKDGKKTPKSSRGSSPKGSAKRKSGKKSKTPEPEPEPPAPEVPPGTPPPQPGSEEWEYVDLPIENPLAEILCSHWENVEETYVNSSKSVFRKVRDERETIIRYFYQIRQDFLEYLRRPDHKQEFVAQWQKAYNEVADDMREDEETRSELHQQVDDLRERLWNISDERKENAEKERADVMNDGWLDDRLGILSNLFLTLMQTEIDRYQDTIQMIKDYYRGMEGKIPDESPAELARLPLIELPPTERAVTPAKSVSGSEPPGTPTENVAQERGSKPTTPSGEQQPPQQQTEDKKSKIPLMPRRPGSADLAAMLGKDKKKSVAKKEDRPDSPGAPQDLDERLVYEAYGVAVGHIEKILKVMQKIAAEQAAKDAEEEAEKEKERQRELEAQKAKSNDKGKKGGKGGKKSRSPSPKKGGKGKKEESKSPIEPTPPPAEEESEEVKAMKKVKERMRQEFIAAIQDEASGAKSRIELIRLHTIAVIHDLKNKADSAFKDMNDWLGARFLKEMEGIDQMSEIMRNNIESGQRIKEELAIQQEDFLLNTDVKVVRTPSPKPRPDPIEEPLPDTFTINQLVNVFNQFTLTAPSGVLSIKAFEEMFLDLTSLTHGTEHLPDMWMNLSTSQMEALTIAVSPDGEFIDWKTFLLSIAQPLPTPSQQELLDNLERYKEMDQKNTGCVTREQYDRVDMWFKSDIKPPSPDDPSVPLPYDRLTNLKSAFFEVFADHSMDPPQLDYVNMLMYFSVHPDPYEGFLRALSVASGTHMPRILKTIPIRPASQASAISSVEIEKVDAYTEDIPEEAVHSKVPLDALDRVLHHGQSSKGDSHRFSVTSDPEDAYSRDRLAGVYQDLGSEDLQAVLFTVLIEHPVIQDMVSTLRTYKAVDVKSLLSAQPQDNIDTHSMKTIE